MTLVANFPAPILDEFAGSKHLSDIQDLPTKTEVSSNINALNEPGYKVREQWHSQPRHLRVIHVGAGAAGLLMAYKMKKDFANYSLVCYEKYL